MRFELMIQPWQGRVLPLYYIRNPWWTIRESNPTIIACKAIKNPSSIIAHINGLLWRNQTSDVWSQTKRVISTLTRVFLAPYPGFEPSAS